MSLLLSVLPVSREIVTDAASKVDCVDSPPKALPIEKSWVYCRNEDPLRTTIVMVSRWGTTGRCIDGVWMSNPKSYRRILAKLGRWHPGAGGQRFLRGVLLSESLKSKLFSQVSKLLEFPAANRKAISWFRTLTLGKILEELSRIDTHDLRP